ncbi:MAG: pyruvate/oxaloacetate carboxyltransferase [archaeon]
MSRIRITDTTFRDAHQSLAATRMKTDQMLSIAKKMDSVGFYSMEVWGGATFDVCIRYLNEDPWERIRALKRNIRHTPLQMLLRGQNLVGYRHYADDVVENFVEAAANNGIDIFRIFDALNDARNMETSVKTVARLGRHAQGTMCYTISPVHTVTSYVKLGRRLVSLGCESLCIKDMSGILAPRESYRIVRELKRKTGVPIDVHCHCTSGMAPLTYLRACDAGANILDTAFSPFAWGASQPAVESIVGALRGTEFDTGLKLDLLVDIARYFEELRRKAFDASGMIDPLSLRTDASVLLHQIPGGMISNLISQLKTQNAIDRLEDVLKETPKVRRDLGYPPLVTPTSQIVGTQAVANVISGERYRLVSKEIKDYVRGQYGKHPSPIKSMIRRKIIGDEEIITCRPADLIQPEMARMKEESKDFVKKPEDILTFALFPQVGRQFLQRKPSDEVLGRRRAAAIAVALAAREKSERHDRVPTSSDHSLWRLAARLDHTHQRDV